MAKVEWDEASSFSVAKSRYADRTMEVAIGRPVLHGQSATHGPRGIDFAWFQTNYSIVQASYDDKLICMNIQHLCGWAKSRDIGPRSGRRDAAVLAQWDR